MKGWSIERRRCNPPLRHRGDVLLEALRVLWRTKSCPSWLPPISDCPCCAASSPWSTPSSFPGAAMLPSWMTLPSEDGLGKEPPWLPRLGKPFLLDDDDDDMMRESQYSRGPKIKRRRNNPDKDRSRRLSRSLKKS